MFKKSKQGLILAVKVTPNAKKTEIIGPFGEELAIRLAAPPEKGKANEQLLRFLANVLKVAPTNLKITYGATGRHKRILLLDPEIDETELIKRLTSNV